MLRYQNGYICGLKKILKLNSVRNLIESDMEAVKNAIIDDYSNGLTAGFHNKTKVKKPCMVDAILGYSVFIF